MTLSKGIVNLLFENDTVPSHLYTEDATEEGQATSEDKPKEIKNPGQAKNPLTSPGAIAIYLMLAGASVAGLCLAAYKRTH